VTERRIQVSLPEHVADAVHGEAVRCGQRVGEVLSLFIADRWPCWVEVRLREDLQTSLHRHDAEASAP
jgi:hypothetical protein